MSSSSSSSSPTSISPTISSIPQHQQHKTLVLVGGTGKLGQELAPGLRTAAPGFATFTALVRDPTSAAAIRLQRQGWTLHVVSNHEWTISTSISHTNDNNSDHPPISASPTLIQALTGAFAVVSALSGPRLVELEQALIDAAIHAHVTLFVPSQYGVDQRRWQREQGPSISKSSSSSLFPSYQKKRQVLEYYHQRRIQEQRRNDQEDSSRGFLSLLYVACGLFADVIFESMLVDRSTQQAAIVEDDGHALYSFTRRSDVGRVLAHAVKDPQYHRPKPWNDNTHEHDPSPALQSCHFLTMAGTTLSLYDALTLLQSYSSTRPFTITHVSLATSLAQERALLESYHQNHNTTALYHAFRAHILNRPVLGDTGMDTSGGSTHRGSSTNSTEQTNTSNSNNLGPYGISLEPLHETFRKQYQDEKKPGDR